MAAGVSYRDETSSRAKARPSADERNHGGSGLCVPPTRAFWVRETCLCRPPPPLLSSTAIWSPIPQPKEIGREKRFSEEQIIGFLREAEAGVAVKDLCRKHGFSEASYYLWRSKFGGMTVPEAKRLKELETENARLKKLLAESMLEIEMTREALRRKW